VKIKNLGKVCVDVDRPRSRWCGHLRQRGR